METTTNEVMEQGTPNGTNSITTMDSILNLIQVELSAPKDQKNEFAEFNYRSAEDILAALKPLLEKHKATLTLSDEVVAVLDRVYVKATATIITENGETSTTAFAREATTKKGMDDAQITGSASSYARKYALNGLFAIDNEKDADAQDNSDYYCKVCGAEAELKTAKDGSGIQAVVCLANPEHKEIIK